MIGALRWVVGGALFVALLFLSLDNAEVVTLKLFRVASWQAPLVFVLLVVFVAGVVIGLLAWIPTVVRQRREISRLRKAATIPPMVPLSPEAEPPHGI